MNTKQKENNTLPILVAYINSSRCLFNLNSHWISYLSLLCTLEECELVN